MIRGKRSSSVVSEDSDSTLDGSVSHKSKQKTKKGKHDNNPELSKVEKNNLKLQEEIYGPCTVEKILDWAFDERGNILYHIRWQGWDSDGDTWEPEKHLPSDLWQLKKFLRQKQKEDDYYEDLKNALRHLISNDYTDVATLLRLTNNSLKKYNYSSKSDNLMKGSIRQTLYSPLNDSRMTSKKKCSIEKWKIAALRVDQVEKILSKLHNGFESVTEFLEFYEKRKKFIEEKKLKKLENKWNEIIRAGEEGEALKIENYFDFELPPDITYVTSSILSHGQSLKDFYADSFHQINYCECRDCYAEKDLCCVSVIGFEPLYTKEGLLKNHLPTYGVECNSSCKCPKTCYNRVVQHGRKYKLALFKTEDKGWGVRALEPIPKGAFVTQYCGEIINETIAFDTRDPTYVFSLVVDDVLNTSSKDLFCSYFLDGKFFGNISRFINHSCDPNMVSVMVWTEDQGRRTPLITLFAKRTIRENEELSYDYVFDISTMPNVPYYAQAGMHLRSPKKNDSSNASTASDDISTHKICNGDQHLAIEYKKDQEPETNNNKLNEQNKFLKQKKQVPCKCGSAKCKGSIIKYDTS